MLSFSHEPSSTWEAPLLAAVQSLGPDPYPKGWWPSPRRIWIRPALQLLWGQQVESGVLTVLLQPSS